MNSIVSSRPLITYLILTSSIKLSQQRHQYLQQLLRFSPYPDQQQQIYSVDELVKSVQVYDEIRYDVGASIHNQRNLIQQELLEIEQELSVIE